VSKIPAEYEADISSAKFICHFFVQVSSVSLLDVSAAIARELGVRIRND
jgi:hypothetical protein